MGEKYTAFLLFVFLNLAINAQSKTILDVTTFGAKQNGEISQAVNAAWAKACEATTPTTVHVPKGSYSMNAILLKGPCKAPVEFKVDGIVKAPIDPAQIPDGHQWITANYLEHFTFSGSGTLDGQGGLKAWKMNDCHKNKKCPKLAYNLSFNFLKHSTISGITSKDSKNFHVNVIGCNNVTFVNFKINAPGDSPNTDGIHVALSNDVHIINSRIATGDDCISIGDGMTNLFIEKVTCGPGHGISVGSLGRSPGEKDVNGIFVKNCTFIKTTNGVRIKTWPNSHPGVVTNVHFEDLIMDNVQNPVHVEQDYCPYNNCVKEKPSLVKLSNLSFKNIRGTSATQVAVKLRCSPGVPCQDVHVGAIDLKYTGPEGPAITECSHTKPIFAGKQNPPVCAAPVKEL